MLPPPPMAPCAEQRAALQSAVPTQTTSNAVAKLLKHNDQAPGSLAMPGAGLTLTRSGSSSRKQVRHDNTSSTIGCIIRGEADANESTTKKCKDGRSSPRGPMLGPRSYDNTYAGLEAGGAPSG